MANKSSNFMWGTWACGHFWLYLHWYHAASSTPVQTLCRPCAPVLLQVKDRLCPRAGWGPCCCCQGQAFRDRTQLAHLALLKPCTVLPEHLLLQCFFSARKLKFTSQQVWAWRDFMLEYLLFTATSCPGLNVCHHPPHILAGVAQIERSLGQSIAAHSQI